MPGGRPPRGVDLVEGLEGSPEAKSRLKAALETMLGTKTIGEASEELGLKEAMLHVLRTRALEGALGALEPRPIGRPRRETDEGGDLEALREENAALKRRLKELEVKEELMAALPGLRSKPKAPAKKG